MHRDEQDIFDQWASAAPVPDLPSEPNEQADAQATGQDTDLHATPPALRRAVQELLKYGLLEQAGKPHLFRQIASDTRRIDTLLEPLDLQVQVDDVRGLAFVVIPSGYQPEDAEEDDWSHPLVRRQRLTLEQSLLVAILRREFLQREQEGGIGMRVQLGLEQLLPQIEIYLGSTGSDMQERKRLVNLLENLRSHGVVSEIDAQDRFTIRPMIVHLANPQNLQALLQRLKELAAQGAMADPDSAPEQ